MSHKTVKIDKLMAASEVKFGTSGARGLAARITDEVGYTLTAAFIQYLEEGRAIKSGAEVAVGGDLRPSTDRIMRAAIKAIADRGYRPVNCGLLPSPALAYFSLEKALPSIMVTGSHIPQERNGIKFVIKEGEILKKDEAAIKRQAVAIPGELFDAQGNFKSPAAAYPVDPAALELYRRRYLDFFPAGCLTGKRIGVYQHSAVARELMAEVFAAWGAEVFSLGFSDEFIPVDTEAIRPEDVALAKEWSKVHRLDAIVSTDGDSDRPLVSDEEGNWLRGDIAPILCAKYCRADAVATPITSNSAVDQCGWFKKVYRTRIGSPYVIEAMRRVQKEVGGLVAGYEANGGFLLNADLVSNGRILKALPTRDAMIVLVTVLLAAKEQGKTVAALLRELPARFTHSDRLKDFPVAKSAALIAELSGGDATQIKARLEKLFGSRLGTVSDVNMMDGLRVTFAGGEVLHLRPSGNAPEFRCYSEAASEKRARAITQIGLEVMRSF